MFQDPVFILILVLLAVSCVAVVLLYRSTSAQGMFRDSLIRIQQRQEDQGEQASQQIRNLEERLHEQERIRREDHAKLSQDLERRLGELQSTQTQAITELKSALGERFESLKQDLNNQLADARTLTVRALSEQREDIKVAMGEQQTRFEQRQSEALKSLQDSLQNGMQEVRKQVSEALSRSDEELGKRVEGLTKITDDRLKDISGQVDKRLTEGFEKTTATFSDVLKRLALIDEAQKKITELSTNVVSLQEVLADKRSRGAFGEVQLNALISNVMPTQSYALQYQLSNGKQVDCMLFLPAPTGNVSIDSKFPLESYQRMTDIELAESERLKAERQFKQDVRKHISDISEKYIIPGETAEGAMMFIPAEAVFAEIQAHHYDLVNESQKAKVWMVSPTTMMAILNTARAVLKDDATRKQVHIIQEHLHYLSKDFSRFQDRMDKLSKHIDMAQKDVSDAHISARKIAGRFDKIEKVEITAPDALEAENQDQKLIDPNLADS